MESLSPSITASPALARSPTSPR